MNRRAFLSGALALLAAPRLPWKAVPLPVLPVAPVITGAGTLTFAKLLQAKAILDRAERDSRPEVMLVSARGEWIA